MSKTLAGHIVTRALEKALKQDSVNSPFTDSENNTAMDELNDLMTEWSNGYNIRVGFSEVTLMTDETNLPAFTLSAVKNNLALRLSNEFGRPLSPGLVLLASDSLDAMINRVIKIPVVNYPSTLPVGSGNCNDQYRSDFFDDVAKDDLETESGIGIETNRGFELETDTIPTDPDNK